MGINLFETELPSYLQIIISVVVALTLWLPFYKRLHLFARISLIVLIIIPLALVTGFGGVLIFISVFIRTLTLLFNNNKASIYNYTCEKCGFIKELEQTLKLYKCSHCGHENLIE